MARVYTVFAGKPIGQEGWPYADFDPEKRAGQLLKQLEEISPGIEIIGKDIIYDLATALQAAEKIKKETIDAVLVFTLTSHHHDYSLEGIIGTGHPTILVSDLYGGDLLFLEAWGLARETNLPVIPISSSKAEDWEKALRLIKIIAALKGKKIALVEGSKQADDQSHFWRRAYEDYLKAAENILGVQIVVVKPEELLSQYEAVDAQEVREIARKWVEEAWAVIEPDEIEIAKSARLYLAMKHVMAKTDAIGISVDCLALFYEGQLPAYPCLGHFQLNNQGLLGACEADLEAALTQLVGQFLTARPGFISDPVIDIGSSQIIYAHCVCHNRPFGKDGPAFPYRIRSHAEDRKGASVQTLLPPGYPLTSVKMNFLARKIAIHQARSIGNVEVERACRTKLAAEANAAKILKNWDFQTFGWHRVTFFGDFRNEFCNLAKLLKLAIVEEDA